MIALRKIAGILAAPFAFALAAATPAQAEDIVVGNVAPATKVGVETDGPMVIGDENAEYRQLYAQWRAHEHTKVGKPTAPRIAVPSGMPLSNAHLTSDYGMRTHPVLGGRRSHKGVDLAAATGTPVYATADGYVERADWFSSYGLFIKIEHGAQVETRFAHLSKLTVSAGERVKKGDIIGYVGSTGRSTGPHLHYEVRVGGQAVDPTPYMAQSELQEDFALAVGN